MRMRRGDRGGWVGIGEGGMWVEWLRGVGRTRGRRGVRGRWWSRMTRARECFRGEVGR